MPVITPTQRKTNGHQKLEKTILDGTDNLIFNANKDQVLVLENSTASPVSVLVVGSNASATYIPKGYGDPIDLTGGYHIEITANETQSLYLPSISQWLMGDVSITGGSGLIASLLEG